MKNIVVKSIALYMCLISVNIAADSYYYNDYPVRRCCTDAQSAGQMAGPDREWRYENISVNNFTIYRRSADRHISFTDLAEQPAISGFERSVYTSPK